MSDWTSGNAGDEDLGERHAEIVRHGGDEVRARPREQQLSSRGGCRERDDDDRRHEEQRDVQQLELRPVAAVDGRGNGIDGGKHDGIMTYSCLASYMHLHFYDSRFPTVWINNCVKYERN